MKELRESWAGRFPHFTPEEVISPMGMRAFESGIIVVNFEALEYLHQFRQFVNKPLLVNHGEYQRRGTRTYKENLAVGGEDFSYHLLGAAFDITCPAITVSELAELAQAFGWTGIGIYSAKNFVHCDKRPKFNGEPTIWEG